MSLLVFLAQTVSLLLFIAHQATVAAWSLPWLLFRAWLGTARDLLSDAGASAQVSSAESTRVRFFQGQVIHARRHPKLNAFKYPVRVALVNLDDPPDWFKRNQASDHMTAEQARKFGGTSGPVWLLTNPVAAGYTINPISVYYCYNQEERAGAAGVVHHLSKCIAEVTNTPWNERVTFVFEPSGNGTISKALHVSPFMDMKSTWLLEATDPSHLSLRLMVRVRHPEHGNFFDAYMVAKACEGRHASSRNEEAGLGTFLKFGLQPHRIAVWIYYQAVVLLVKGVPLFSPPPFAVLEGAARGTTHPVNQVTMCPFVWRRAQRWPWDTWGKLAKA